MILGGNQPYFMPYIGYWQLINAVDIFKISDDYNYIKHGWVSKNRILINGNAANFHIEVKHASSNKLINELEIYSDQAEKKLNQLRLAYKKAPYYKEGIELMNDILTFEDNNLATFLEHSIRCTCQYMGIDTKIVKSSEFEHNSDYKREYRIFDMCHRIGADTYYNAIGGQALYSFTQFKEEGIQLGFIKTRDVKYKQYKNEFVPNLSIIDVIMFNSREEISDMLNDFSIVKEDR